MRRIPIMVATLVVAAATATAAFAAINVKSYPTAAIGSPDAQSVTVTGGNFSGLGNTPAIATLTAFGQATYECSNGPGHVVPGQNPVEAQPGSSGGLDLGNSQHNGRGTISTITATVQSPGTPTSQEVGCGGSGSTNWTVKQTSLTATCAELVIKEGSTVVFSRTYTADGIGTAGLTC